MDWKQVGAAIVAGVILGAGAACLVFQERLAKVEAAVEFLREGGRVAAAEPQPPRAAAPPAQAFLPNPAAPPGARVVLHGPENGTLVSDDRGIPLRRAGVNVRNFVAEARFINAPTPDGRVWSHGFGFRSQGNTSQMRIYIDYVDGEGHWHLSHARPGGDGRAMIEILHSGRADGLRTGPGESNVMRLTVRDRAGFLEVNDRPVANFPASAITSAGDVWVGTAFIVDGARNASFEDFTVWSSD